MSTIFPSLSVSHSSFPLYKNGQLRQAGRFLSHPLHTLSDSVIQRFRMPPTYYYAVKDVGNGRRSCYLQLNRLDSELFQHMLRIRSVSLLEFLVTFISFGELYELSTSFCLSYKCIFCIGDGQIHYLSQEMLSSKND